MRRILTILSIAVAVSAVTVPAYASPRHDTAERRWSHHEHRATVLVVDRVTSPVFQVAPGVDPEPTFPAVTVTARLRGCVPGELYLVHARFFQRHREITGVSGGLGFEEFSCRADGTARISQTRYDASSRLRPGKLRVTLEVRSWEQGKVLARAAARVRVPR
jgi:hypothetical protein